VGALEFLGKELEGVALPGLVSARSLTVGDVRVGMLSFGALENIEGTLFVLAPAGTVAGPPLLPTVPGDFEVEAFTISGFDLLEVAGDTTLKVLDGPVSLPSLLRTSELTVRGGMTSLALPSLGQTDGLTILNAAGLWNAMDESNIAGTVLMLNNGTGLQQCPT
jgi:hypothetical protein